MKRKAKSAMAGHQDPHYFGRGKGFLEGWWLPILQELGAWFVNLQGKGCACGKACTNDDCPAMREHQFAVPDRGDGPNQSAAREVMRAVELVRRQLEKGARR